MATARSQCTLHAEIIFCLFRSAGIDWAVSMFGRLVVWSAGLDVLAAIVLRTARCSFVQKLDPGPYLPR